MHRQRRADPERIGKMIAARVAGVGMYQNAQSPVVEHQPWHELRKDFLRKGDLVHGLIMRADLDVMPAPERDGKALAHPVAQPLGGRARRRRIVIDVGVIACDLVERARALRLTGHADILCCRPCCIIPDRRPRQLEPRNIRSLDHLGPFRDL